MSRSRPGRAGMLAALALLSLFLVTMLFYATSSGACAARGRACSPTVAPHLNMDLVFLPPQGAARTRRLTCWCVRETVSALSHFDPAPVREMLYTCVLFALPGVPGPAAREAGRV